MRNQTWLVLISLLLIVTPACAVCYWDPEPAPPPGETPCTGDRDSSQNHWTRLPSDAEIGNAKEEYLSYLVKNDGTGQRIDEVTVAKYHVCEGGSWVNHVEMEVDASWYWQSSSGTESEWRPYTSDTFLIYNPGRDTFEFAWTRVSSPYFSGLYTGTVQGFATGACSTGSTRTGSSPQPDDDNNTWIVIIGAAAIIGAGAVIGAKKLGAKGKTIPEKKKKEENGEEKVRYILQLSSDHLTVTPDTPASLKVTAWKVIGTRPPAPAPEAAITLAAPAGGGGLSIQPASGTGSVEVVIALANGVRTSPVIITVTAAVGKSAESAPVTVDIPAEYLMEFF